MITPLLTAAYPFACKNSAFDVLTTAGHYSTLSGVLAGFAFAALSLLLTAQLGGRVADSDEEHAARADAALVLTVAVIGLVLSAIAYAVVSGGRISGDRTASEEIITGAALVSSATILFYAIVLLFDAAEHPQAGNGPLHTASAWLRVAFGFVVTPLCSLYLSSAGFEYFHIMGSRYRWLYHLTELLFILPLLSALAGRLHRPASGQRGNRAFAFCASAVVLSAALAFAVIDSGLGPCDRAPLAVVVATFVATTAFLSLAAWHFTHDPRTAAAPPPSQQAGPSAADNRMFWTTAAAAVVALLTLGFGVLQLHEQTDTQHHELEAHLQERMTELDQFFVARPRLRPFFYKNHGVPDSGTLRAQVIGTGEMMIDVAATVGAGMDGLDAAQKEQWRNIMHAYWCQSPAIRRNWSKWANDYTPDTSSAFDLGRTSKVAKGNFDPEHEGRETCTR